MRLSSCLCVPLYQIFKQINDFDGTWYEGYTTEGVIKLSKLRCNMEGARAYDAGAILSSHIPRSGNYVSQYILQQDANSVQQT